MQAPTIQIPANPNSTGKGNGARVSVELNKKGPAISKIKNPEK